MSKVLKNILFLVDDSKMLRNSFHHQNKQYTWFLSPISRQLPIYNFFTPAFFGQTCKSSWYYSTAYILSSDTENILYINLYEILQGLSLSGLVLSYIKISFNWSLLE
jgi:hypothetical protein